MHISRSSSCGKKDIIRRVAAVLRDECGTATNVESAVDRAGISRDDVNAVFGSMQALVLEMVSELSGTLAQPLEDQGTDRTMRDVLTEFGNQLVNAYSASHLIALYRIALNETARHPKIGQEFFERGHGKLTHCLAHYLEHSAQRAKQLRLRDPELAADIFLSLLGDNLKLPDATTATRLSSAKDHTHAVTEAVELLCHGVLKEGQ